MEFRSARYYKIGPYNKNKAVCVYFTPIIEQRMKSIEKDFTTEEVVEYLRELEKTGVTRYRIAHDLNISQSTIANWLNGKSTPTKNSCRTLIYYLRLGEYKKYQTDISLFPDEELFNVTYSDFISRVKPRPLYEVNVKRGRPSHDDDERELKALLSDLGVSEEVQDENRRYINDYLEGLRQDKEESELQKEAIDILAQRRDEQEQKPEKEEVKVEHLLSIIDNQQKIIDDYQKILAELYKKDKLN